MTNDDAVVLPPFRRKREVTSVCMDIWDKGPKRVLRFLLSSTASTRCFGEIHDASSMSASAVTSVLKGLLAEGVVLRREEEGEYEGESPNPKGAPHVYYPLNPKLSQDAINILQWGMPEPNVGDLFPPSTGRYPKAGSR